MKDFFKQAAPYIFIAIVSFLVGMFVARSVDPKSSIYFDAKLGKGIGFAIGKNSLSNYDLSTIKKNEVALVKSQIEDLTYKNNLSVELRDIRDRAVGPFKERDIDLRVKFTDDETFNGNLAQACRGEVLFKELSIFRVVEPVHTPIDINEMKEFKVLLEKEKYHCTPPDIDGKTIWINKNTARKWLNAANEELPPEIIVKASILRTIIYKVDSPIKGPAHESAKLNET